MNPLRVAITPDVLQEALAGAPWQVFALAGALLAVAGVAGLVMRVRRRRRTRRVEPVATASAAAAGPWTQVPAGSTSGWAETAPPTPLLGTPVPFGPPAPPAPLPGRPKPPAAGPTEVLPLPRAGRQDRRPSGSGLGDASANPWFRVPVEPVLPAARWPQQQAVR